MAAGGYSAIILGSGQDGGVPQLGAPRVPGPGRTASSVAVVGDDATAVLLDASPDLRLQQRRLGAAPEYVKRTADSAAFDAVLVTHAHMGHYAGLVHFGREAHDTRSVPCHASGAVLDFLGGNEPWSSLFRRGNLLAREIVPGTPFRPVAGLDVVAHAVPHRPDFSDTLAFELTGSSGRSLLYLPDIDGWDDWSAARAVLARVDTALIDGTFYSPAEHPGRDLTDVPHPPVTDTLTRFGDLAGGTRIVFTHLNWTNPIGRLGTAERAEVRKAGFSVASDGMVVAL